MEARTERAVDVVGVVPAEPREVSVTEARRWRRRLEVSLRKAIADRVHC